MKHKPTELSVGQQQRVAIARALAQNSAFLLMDEPTGNVDIASRDSIIAMIKELNATRCITIIVVTHDPEIARCTRRVIHLVNGTIQSEGNSAPQPMGEKIENLRRDLKS